MTEMADDSLEKIKRVKALADTGLLYAVTEYDKERYLELREIALSMIADASGFSVHDLAIALPPPQDYPTAKVDIRAMVVSPDGKILLVKEQADSRWSLPGGWADVGFTPREVAVKEVREETGLDVVPERILAIFDKKMHAHPNHVNYVYKIVIHCALAGGTTEKGFDVLDVGFFPLNALPELSEDRILKSQIELAYGKLKDGGEPYFD